MFILEVTSPQQDEALRVELTESEQYEIASPNPILVEDLAHGPRNGLFIIRPNGTGTVTLNLKIGAKGKKTFYVSSQTENPYVYGEPIKDDRLFFGRVAELSEIHRGLTKRNKQNYLITGPRRVGKTSLLYQLKARLQYPFLSLMLTPENMGHEHYQVFRCILMQLREESQESLGEEPPPLSWELKTANSDTALDLFNFYLERDLKKHLKWLAELSDETRVILLLDEATFLTADYSGSMPVHDSRQEFLRHLLQAHDRVACVLAGTPKLLQMTTVTSPLYNIFSGIKVKGLSRDETAKLIRDPAQQANVAFDDAAVREIIEYGGCSPYYTQALCSLALEDMYEVTQRPPDPDEMLTITVAHVDAAIHRIGQTISHGLQSLWDALEPDERETLRVLAAHGSVERVLDNRDVIDRLVDMNLAMVNEDTQFASVKARLDEEWLRQQGGER